jgi:hypothetical protein
MPPSKQMIAILKTFCSHSKEYDHGYKDGQHHLFVFVVVLEVACVIGGVVVGMCI